jgi:hypothetical protein
MTSWPKTVRDGHEQGRLVRRTIPPLATQPTDSTSAAEHDSSLLSIPKLVKWLKGMFGQECRDRVGTARPPAGPAAPSPAAGRAAGPWPAARPRSPRPPLIGAYDPFLPADRYHEGGHHASPGWCMPHPANITRSHRSAQDWRSPGRRRSAAPMALLPAGVVNECRPNSARRWTRRSSDSSRSSRAATLLYEPARATTRQPCCSGAMPC